VHVWGRCACPNGSTACTVQMWYFVRVALEPTNTVHVLGWHCCISLQSGHLGRVCIMQGSRQVCSMLVWSVWSTHLVKGLKEVWCGSCINVRVLVPSRPQSV
jgi:hypothetical protein